MSTAKDQRSVNSDTPENAEPPRAKVLGLNKYISDADAIAKLVETTGSADTVEDAIYAALCTVRDALGWTYGSYWTVSENHTLEYYAEVGDASKEFKDATTVTKFKKGQGIGGRVWDRKEILFVADLGTMVDCPRQLPAIHAGIKSGVGIPITQNYEVVGVMDFFTTDALEKSPELINLLNSVGRCVSGALTRIRDQVRQAEVAANAIAVTKVVTATMKSTSPNDAALAALDTVREEFNWAYCSYWQLDDKNYLSFEVESGVVNEEFRKATLQTKFQKGQGLSGRAWLKNDLVFVRDLGSVADCPRQPAAVAAGVKSGVALPITFDGRVLGVMDFFALDELTLSKDRIEALRTIGRLVSEAISRITLANKQYEVAENTRSVNKVLEATTTPNRKTRLLA